jgi:hypothetical protein
MTEPNRHRPGRAHTSRTYPVVPIYQTTTFELDDRAYEDIQGTGGCTRRGTRGSTTRGSRHRVSAAGTTWHNRAIAAAIVTLLTLGGMMVAFVPTAVVARACRSSR